MTSYDWVLALDDDPWALEITRSMLQHHDIPVQTVRSEHDAEAAIDRHGPPAVLLLDVMMPGVDGYEVCRRLRSQPALRHTRVVFATALDTEAGRLAAFEAGADDYLTKPFSEPILIGRIRSLIELARLRDRDAARLEYETVLDTIGEGVITLDARDEVLAANEAAVRLLGLSRSEMRGLHLPSHVAQHWTTEGPPLERSAKTRILRHESASGTVAVLDCVSRTLPRTRDSDAAWTLVVRDAKDQWERDRVLGRLTRMMNHKLRIPLAGVTTALDLLIESDLTDEARSLVDIAAASSERLSATLVRILEFTQSWATIGGSVEILDSDRVGEELRVDEAIDVTHDLTRPIVIDMRVVRETIAEFIRNARAAGGERLTLEVHSNPDGTVTFSLTDDGRGIPISMRDRVFEPFFQVDRTGEGDGTGLGLAIAAIEVEARGGAVGVDAPRGGGTTVWFRLPARPAAADLAAEQAASQPTTTTRPRDHEVA
jgi:signal transduction histidine kinase